MNKGHLRGFQPTKCPLRQYFRLAAIPRAVENRCFLTPDPAAQKKSIIFGHATLQRRKNSLFFDERASGAEKIHCFLTLDPRAQKKLVVF